MPMDRRTFLRRVAAAAAGSATAGVPWPGLAAGGANPIENVILVRFGGGTRYTEWIGDPDHRYIPNLWSRLRPQGTLFTNVTNEGRTGHFPGALYLATGRFDWYELEGRTRPETPTLFEHLRKAKRWEEREVVLANHHHETNRIAYSTHAEFGPEYGALLLHPADVRLRKMDQMLAQDALPQERRVRIERMRERLTARMGDRAAELGGLRPDDPAHQEFVRALDPKRARDLDGNDAAIAYEALTAMRTLSPRFMMVVFQQIDVAHRGYWSLYTRAIANTDRLTHELVEASQTLPFYRGRTAVVIVPDCGRSLDGRGNYGFQNHHAPDVGCRQMGMLVIGPGLRRGAVVDTPVTQADVAPTVGEMLGVSIAGTEGRVLHELWS